MTTGDEAEAKALEHVSQRLQVRLGLPADVVEAAIAEARAAFSGRPVRDFVPILVEREVIERLASAGDRSTPPGVVPGN